MNNLMMKTTMNENYYLKMIVKSLTYYLMKMKKESLRKKNLMIEKKNLYLMMN